MNILVTSVGRQAFLLKAFKKSLSGKGKVFASDVDPMALAQTEADRFFVSPEFTKESYIPWVKEICISFEIDVIISLNVDDIIILSEASNEFSEINCQLISGDTEMIKITNDKYKLQDISRQLDLPVLNTYLIEEFTPTPNNFPLVAKPRYGKGARGNVVLSDMDSFLNFKNNLNELRVEYVFQDFLEGTEYGFDIINDFNGSYLRLLGREKITQKNGESFQAISIDPWFWEKEAQKLSAYLKHKGTVNFDVIFSEGKGYLIDVNYRFSGDYIFSHSAGANTPQIYVDCFFNKTINKELYQPEYNIVFERVENGAKRI